MAKSFLAHWYTQQKLNMYLSELKFTIFNFRAFDHRHGMEKWCYKSTQQCCHVRQFDINGYIGIYRLISIKNGHPINPHCIMSIWTDYFLTPVCVSEVSHTAKISQKKWLKMAKSGPKWCLCVIPEVLNKKHSSHHIFAEAADSNVYSFSIVLLLMYYHLHEKQK